MGVGMNLGASSAWMAVKWLESKVKTREWKWGLEIEVVRRSYYRR